MPKPIFPSRDADKFVVRLPDGLREEVKQAAASNQRSMNNEIVTRIIAGNQPHQVVNTWTPQLGMAVQLKLDDRYDVIVGFEVFKETLYAKLQEHCNEPVAIDQLKPVTLPNA